MKYINHMTSSADDEKHMALMDASGLEGYAAYWLIAEKIASQIRPESVSTSLSLSWRSWGLLLRVDPRKARRLIGSVGEAKLCRLDVVGDVATVDMPNLLKYADDYMKRILRNSGVTPDKLRSYSVLQAVPAVQAEQIHTCDSSAAADDERVSGPRKRTRGHMEYPPQFQEFWSAYPRSVAKQVAFQRWQAVVKAGYPTAHLLAAAKEYAGRCEKQGTEERFVMHPATFLAKDRWKDYVFRDAIGVA